MQALTARDRDADVAGLSLADLLPYAAQNDVIVRGHAFARHQRFRQTIIQIARDQVGERS